MQSRHGTPSHDPYVLPSVSWGRLYQGVKQSKTTMQQVDDTTGWVEARSEIDVRLLELAPDKARPALSIPCLSLKPCRRKWQSGIFYHDTKESPKVQGLAARYSEFTERAKIDAANPLASDQVIDGGGTGSDNTSVWFVTWGDHATAPAQSEGNEGRRQDR